jgi:hypothetical protein
VAKAKPGQRIVLQLDPRIALEAIILNRHERIPPTRRQEWLRGLLVQGFRTECQTLRDASDDAIRRPTTGLKSQKAGEMQKAACLTKSEPSVVTVTPSPVDTAVKPFADLGKVIG